MGFPRAEIEHWRDIPSDPMKIPWRWWSRPRGAITVNCECRLSPEMWSRKAYWEFGTVDLLSNEEMDEAKRVGMARHVSAWAKRRRDTVNVKTRKQDLIKHQNGAMGECAFGKFGLKGPWTKDVDVFHEKPDFPPDIEVRLAVQGYPNLWFREGDLAIQDRRFVAEVLHPDGYIRIHAWAYGYEMVDYPKSKIGHGPLNRLVHIYDMHRFPFHKPKPVRF